jgi:hypothetical protein
MEHRDKVIDVLRHVQRMREKQRAFFRGDKSVVLIAKKLEKECDDKVAYLLGLLEQRPSP